ncbi:hypothetical protein D9613_005369 [Agrocybe pediades]|uniref:Oxidoreductase n=1 Tax=Agrocybe pediades TaxID=84607 RepID=A0A8H4R0D9_9AGAR|nr:hypothetical protein D9613_005369 [Agrocybe pediades]
MARPINTCVLGVGLAGLTFHVPFILALPHLFTLHSVLERNPRTDGGKVQERFGFTPKIYRSIEQVLADPEIDLVIIGTPNNTHYEFAKAALNAGKHGKSFTFRLWRWDSDFLALKRLLALPETSPHSIGHILEVESHFDRYRKGLKGTWKDEPLPAAGITYDLGAHLIDQALHLFGQPTRVTGFKDNIRRIGNLGVDDCFTLYMHYAPNDTRPHPLTIILRSHPLSVKSPQLRFLVRGTKGTFTKYGVDVQEDQLKVISSPKAILEDQFGMEPDYLWGTVEKIEADDLTVTKSTWPSTDAGAYVELFQNLAGSIRNEEEPLVKWEEAMNVIGMIELVHRSATEGSTIVVAQGSM